MPNPKKKTTLSLSAEIVQKLHLFASLQEREKSEVVETALTEYLERIGGEKLNEFFQKAATLAESFQPSAEAPKEQTHSKLPGDEV